MDVKLEELRKLCGDEVDCNLRSGGEDGLTEGTLRRWLIARKGDVKVAARDLRAHAAWRAAYVPRGIISAAEVQDEIDQQKAFLPGLDKSGRPFCILVASQHCVKDAEIAKRFIAYNLDCAILLGSTRPGWDGKMNGIFDLRGLKASNCDLATLRNVFDLLQNHYPERLHTLWLFNAPLVFYGLYKLVYPFIDPATKEKVKFVYGKEAEAEFLAAFDPDVLPVELCSKGTGRWVTAQEQYTRLLLKQKEEAAEAAGAVDVSAVQPTAAEASMSPAAGAAATAANGAAAAASTVVSAPCAAQQ